MSKKKGKIKLTDRWAQESDQFVEPETKEDNGVIYNDTVENDDWMKTLPGYKDEVRLHEELAEKLRKGKGGKATVRLSGD